MDYIANYFSCICSVFILLLLVVEVPCSQFIGDELSATLNHFEVLHSLDVRHRTKRYVDPERTDDFHQVWIPAFGKQFHLSMKKSMILSHDFHTTLISRDGSSQDYLSSSYEFYSGTLHGEKDTRANVYWEDGLLTASIVTAEEVYFVEPARRYVSTVHNLTLIVYRKSDLKVTQDPWDGVMSNLKTPCKHQRNTTMKQIQPNQENKGPDRWKRAVDFGNRKYCRIILVADHYFHENVGRGSILATQNYMIGVLDRVNSIYQTTSWPDDTGVTGLGFEISKIIIHIEPSGGEGHYNQANRKTDMGDTLDIFSTEFFLNSACLVHLFTYSSFQQGLGLAFIASWRSYDFGGICSPMSYVDKMAGNTGLTTLRNRVGNKVLTLQSTITTAHELGHNWGSGHDNADSAECSDFYIMYPTSQEGTHSNNVLFSPCSRRSIYKVLELKGRDCLKEKNPYLAYCGNGRLESGEECDSGTRPDDCCTDQCVLTPGSDCSPFNKACCSQCKLAQSGTVCLQTVDDNFDCKGNAQCNGFQYDCPPPTKKPDNTSCHDAGKCIDGSCVGFCQQMGMIPCVCSPESGLACYRCCKSTSDSKCVSFSELLDNGRTCYQGYCQAGVCIKSSSKMNKFWNALGSQVINSFDVFMRDNIVFFITLFSLILWLPVVLIMEYFEKKKARQDEMLIRRQANRHMREKVEIPPEGEKESSIRHVGSLSISGARSSRARDSYDTFHRAHIEPLQEYAGHSSKFVKSGSQPLYTEYQNVSTLPQSWKPGGYDRKAQRIPLTVDNLSDQPGYRKDGSRHNQTKDPKLKQLSVDNLFNQRGYRKDASALNQTRSPKLQQLSVDNLSDLRYRTDAFRRNYEEDPVSQPRRYPSHLELGRGVNTLPYSVRRPIDRYPGNDTGNHNNKASTLPLPSRGYSYNPEQKPSNIDKYTFGNEPLSHAGYPSFNKLPLTIKPATRSMYPTDNGHVQGSVPNEDDGQYFKPISHRSSDTDYESTPRSAPHSYYYHENPYEEPGNVSHKYAPGGQGETNGYGNMPSHYGPSFSTENLLPVQNSPRQMIDNEHQPARHGGHHSSNRYMNLAYESDLMTVTETMI